MLTTSTVTRRNVLRLGFRTYPALWSIPARAASSERSSSDIRGLREMISRQEDMLTQLMLKLEQLESKAVAGSSSSSSSSKVGQPNAESNPPFQVEAATPHKNPRGFVEFQRKSQPYRDARERVRDYKEINAENLVNERKLQIQASRCMDCGTPFCQTYTGCPVNNLIPEWNDLVVNGQWREAIDRLHATNNFPEFTGRVCPAPCEGACVAGLVGDPVTIKDIEYQIVDHAFKHGWIQPRHVPHRTGRKVGVVGSGPAGLAAADQLNQLGHSVTVFEREDKIGGLLYYGIPSMKLDKATVDRRVQLLKDEGISFAVNTNVGETLSASQIEKDFDAVVLCVGATDPRPLNIPGSQLNGVHYAMDFLTANQKDLHLNADGKLVNQWTKELISAEGKHVVVIGGGDTGTDCIGTSMRQYCKSLVNLEILPEKPASRDEATNPWPLYPRIYKMDYGHEEAAAVFGKDPRLFSVDTLQILGDGSGNVKAIRVVEVEQREGRFKPVSGSVKDIPADLVLLAMGYVGPEPKLLEAFGVQSDEAGNVKAAYGDYRTTKEKIFTAGDCRRGASLVVWAINEGRGVAESVNKFLESS